MPNRLESKLNTFSGVESRRDLPRLVDDYEKDLAALVDPVLARDGRKLGIGLARLLGKMGLGEVGGAIAEFLAKRLLSDSNTRIFERGLIELEEQERHDRFVKQIGDELALVISDLVSGGHVSVVDDCTHQRFAMVTDASAVAKCLNRLQLSVDSGFQRLEAKLDALREVPAVSIHPNCSRYVLVITGTVSELDQDRVDELVRRLRELSGDINLRLIGIEAGSVRLVLEGSKRGMAALQALLDSDHLSSELGVEVVALESVPREASDGLTHASEQVPAKRDLLSHSLEDPFSVLSQPQLRSELERIVRSSLVPTSQDKDDLVQSFFEALLVRSMRSPVCLPQGAVEFYFRSHVHMMTRRDHSCRRGGGPSEPIGKVENEPSLEEIIEAREFIGLARSRLRDSELAVLDALVRGESAGEIGLRLGQPISSSYVWRLRRKLKLLYKQYMTNKWK